MRCWRGSRGSSSCAAPARSRFRRRTSRPTYVIGQEDARRAVEVAAAGGHHLLLVGPPGTGKTMLAQRMVGLLPRLAHDEALALAAVRLVAGRLPVDRPLGTLPPLVAPHHSASMAALVGGGSGLARPGAVSLAHRGVLSVES
jgi:magnesium chelatase family protein